MVITSSLPDVSIPDVPVTPYIFENAGERATKAALVDGPSGRTYDFATLEMLIHRFAGGLVANGFQPGGVLMILAPNVPEYVIALHGTLVCGGTATTANPTYTARELRHQMEDSGATWLFTIPLFLPLAREAMADGSSIGRIIVLGEHEPADDLLDAFALVGGDSYEGHAPVDAADHVAVLPYSSGTTGNPKGVMLTHRNLVANLVQGGSMVPADSDDVVIAVLPYFHVYGLQILINFNIRVGATTVSLPRFDLEQFLQVMQDHEVTRAYLVPPIVLALAKHPLVDRYDLSKLKSIVSGAAPLSEELANEVTDRIGVEILQGYGMTETSPATHVALEGSGKPGSVGGVVPSSECRVVDTSTGEDVEQGESGEIWVRGPHIMKGYLNNPEATAETIDADGWLLTGDIGYMDEDGDFYIVDRLKELIKYKGFQVPPAELEGLLLSHPAVADSAVIPVPDDEAGEIPKAFVVLKPGAEATAGELQDFVAGQVASFKQIRELEFIDAIPKAISGKILRRVLRDAELAKRA
ncbi:MAG: 4-coumarate--CoA ligase family protein [bacterium]|nr:4-coumarate--CoA ligase family protein [bacterium]